MTGMHQIQTEGGGHAIGRNGEIIRTAPLSHRDRMRRLMRRIHNGAWERRLGIDTRGLIAIDKPDGVFYAALSYPQTRKALMGLKLTAADTFIDIGCGKGRITSLAARYTPARVVGVEYDAGFCRIAEQNARKLGVEHRVTIVHSSAEDFDYAGINVFFMFTPFGYATLDKVLGKIRADVSGPCRVMFFNCTDEHLAVFRAHPWLREVRIMWDGPMRHVFFEAYLERHHLEPRQVHTLSID